MNLLNAQSHVEYRSIQWLLAAVLVLCALLLASQPIDIGQPIVVSQPRTSSTELNAPLTPHIQPVPVPPAQQHARADEIVETPAPAITLPQPTPQRVATPPAGK